MSNLEYAAGVAWLNVLKEHNFTDDFTPTRQLYYESGYLKGARDRDELWQKIVDKQRESIKKFYRAAQKIENFGYGVNIESKQVITNTEDIMIEACALAIETITETDKMIKEML